MPKIDETTRLQRLDRISLLLMRNARGITESEIADEMRLERRSVNNYLRELELQGKAFKDGLYWFPFTLKESRLRPFDLSPEEAVTLYLGARLLAKQQDKRNEPAETALLKLAMVLKADAGVGGEIEQAARELAGRPMQEGYQPIFRDVVRGYIYRKQIEISYRPLKSNKSFQTTFSTYLIEPSPIGFSTYIIGYSSNINALRAYKLERIESVRLTREDYAVPPDFPGLDILRNAWSIVLGEETVHVVLRFSPDVKKRVLETRWHPSQQTADAPERPGWLRWQVDVADTLDLLPWVRGWGSDCEVLEPESLRNMLKRETQRLARLYQVGEIVTDKTGDSQRNRILLLWGKTQKGRTDAYDFHPAIFHMLDVACVARILLGDEASPRWRNVLADAFNTQPETLINWLPWVISLHDVGKISVPFQEQNDTQRARLASEGFLLGDKRWRNDPPHGIISQVFLKDENMLALPPKFRESLMDMCGGHHGYFNGKESLNNARQALKKEAPEWMSLRRETAQILYEILVNQPIENWPEPSNVSVASMALTGFTILCDWLGSDSAKFLITPDKLLMEYVDLSMERARSAAQDAGFLKTHESSAPTIFGSLFPKITPRPLQSAIDVIPDEIFSEPCLAVIEAPTGEGKTEAALALAHRIANVSNTNELYYALPTTATSNQMFQRLQKYMQENLRIPTQVKLIHGQSFLVQDDLRIDPLENGMEEESDSLDWFGPKKRSMLAPFGVGTIDQAELAALNVKHVPLRMIGLAGKVLIIDEVHAYDTYMTTVIEQLLRWLSSIGTSVILLSATLPKDRRAKLAEAYGIQLGDEMRKSDAYPSLWAANKNHQYCSSPPAQQPNRTIHLDTSLAFSDDQITEKAQWLLDQVKNGGCVCWMTNTVRRAQEIFDAVDKLAPGSIDRVLLHAQLPLDERQRREDEIRAKFGPESKDRKPSIVIGTQVLEQSLDLDFDVMASDIAPVDLLLQRAGRLHRHQDRVRPDENQTPYFYVNIEKTPEGEIDLGVNKYVYDEYILHRTWLALSGKTEIVLPTDYRPLIEFVYDREEPTPDSPLVAVWKKLQTDQKNAIDQANERILPDPHPNDSFAARASRLRFRESETDAGWIIAKTRLGEESINIIPLEKDGETATFTVDGETITINLKSKLPRETQLKLLRHSLRVTNQGGVRAIKQNLNKLPMAFRDGLLKEYVPLFLVDGKTNLPDEKRNVLFTLDPQLGLVIRSEKGV